MPNEITEIAPLNVLVTGATGALGREVTRQLSAAGHHVVGTTNGYENAAIVRADGGIPAYPDLLRAGEIRSIMLASKTDVVINCAPQIANHLPQKPAHWDARLVNEGVAALLEAAQAAEVKFVVHTSYAFADEKRRRLKRSARCGQGRRAAGLEQRRSRLCAAYGLCLRCGIAGTPCGA